MIGFIITTQNLIAQTDNFVLNKKSELLSTGITMSYSEYGTQNTETIVLIHGYTDTSRSFDEVAKYIQKLHPKSRIISPDLRGHGNSSVPTTAEDFKIEDFSKDILALLEEKKISKFHLVGHSLGGMIAQDIAVNHPDKLESLVLISTLTDATKNIAIQDFLKKALIYGEWKTKLVSDFGTDWKQQSYHLTPKHLGNETLTFLKEIWVTEARADTDFLNSIYQETIDISLVTWFETLKRIAEFDITQKMEQLKVPTLVIWGSDDDLMPNQPEQEKIQSVLKSANQNHQTPVFFKTYSKNNSGDLKIGHNLHWAFPKEIATDIIEFQQRHWEIKTYRSKTINLKSTDTF